MQFKCAESGRNKPENPAVELLYATKLTGDYLDQTFTGKLITACRTHDFHRLETYAAGHTPFVCSLSLSY